MYGEPPDGFCQLGEGCSLQSDQHWEGVAHAQNTPGGVPAQVRTPGMFTLLKTQWSKSFYMKTSKQYCSTSFCLWSVAGLLTTCDSGRSRGRESAATLKLWVTNSLYLLGSSVSPPACLTRWHLSKSKWILLHKYLQCASTGRVKCLDTLSITYFCRWPLRCIPVTK